MMKSEKIYIYIYIYILNSFFTSFLLPILEDKKLKKSIIIMIKINFYNYWPLIIYNKLRIKSQYIAISMNLLS
jgi:hypothetical protein